MDLIDRSKLHSVCVVDGIDSEGVITTRSYWASDVANAPTIDAIPVEWLEKKAQEFAERYWNKKDDHKKLMLPMADCPIVIQQMIKEWRVENEID